MKMGQAPTGTPRPQKLEEARRILPEERAQPQHPDLRLQTISVVLSHPVRVSPLRGLQGLGPGL